MASEDAEMMARIAHLAGHINRHKNQQQGSATREANYSYKISRPAHHTHQLANTGYPYARGGYRGRGSSSIRGVQFHRNKTLVLNNSGATTSTKSGGDVSGDTSESATTNATTTPAWIAKTDRHLQLINPAIFEKQSQDRARALEETRKTKLKQKDDRERLRLSKHLMRGGLMSSNSAGSRATPTTTNYEITVQDIRFRITRNGSKLVRLLDDGNASKATPKTALVGGVKFHRSKNGNLYRAGIVKAQRRTGARKKIDEQCKTFSLTGTCPKGSSCPYIHDAARVAMCKEFLQKGSCKAGDACDLSHEPTPERSPACLHFAKGNCSNSECRYSHVRVAPSAPVCRSFGLYGYCEKGANCMERHVNECPDFSNTGACKKKGCKLPHRLKASVIRRNTARQGDGEDGGSSDLSSDEEENEADSDDVDSDDLEKFFGDDADEVDVTFSTQEDYVKF